MATVNGTTGNDFIHVAGDGLSAPSGYNEIAAATNNADIISPKDGDDIIHAGGGNDTIKMPASSFNALDQFDGGDGFDKLELSGSADIVLNATSLTGIERVYFSLQGSTNSLTTVDDNVAAGAMLQVEGANGDGDFFFDGSAETDGSFLIIDFTRATGGSQDDIFRVNANRATQQIDGGSGFDTIELYGRETIDFSSMTVNSVERIALSSFQANRPSFDLTTGDAMVSGGHTLFVTASPADDPNYLSHGFGYTLAFDGSAETDGRFDIQGGRGDDNITAGAGDDIIREVAGGFDHGGVDTSTGGAGVDLFLFTDTYTALDSIDGGTGRDRVYLNGDYSGAHAITFGATTMTNVEELRLHGAFDYDLTTDNATVATGAKLLVNATPVSGGHGVTFDGSAEIDGKFVLHGSAGDDVLTGGTLGDTLTGNGGADHFTYTGVAQSTSTLYDRITDFDTGVDKFDLNVTVADIDATVTGALSKPTFNADLRATFTASTLASGHAALLDVTSGGLSGHTFLVVDANGTAGYQAHADYVFDVTGVANAGSLSVGDFI